MANRVRPVRAERAAVPLDEALGWPAWADPLALQQMRDALRGRIGHAYLLSGPKGVGKAALARAFAQAVVCPAQAGEDRAESCAGCRACRNVARGVHPDVAWFDLATQADVADKASANTALSIDTVRRLRESAALLPLEAARRVIVVDDAETLQEPAQQALLKTLEEPPPAVTILLLSDDAKALLGTVRSRCQAVNVRPASARAIARSLVDHRGIAEAEAQELAALSRGAPAWAMAAAADAELARARRAEWDAAAAWAAAGDYERLTTAFRLGEQFAKQRAEVLGIVQAAVQLWRDGMIRAAGRDRDGGLESDAGALARAASASLRCLADLEANVRPRLALEAMVMQWPTRAPLQE